MSVQSQKLNNEIVSANIGTNHLSGDLLRAARVVWIILALVALVILLTSLPGYTSRFTGELDHLPSAPSTTTTSFFAVAGAVASLASALLSIVLALILFRLKFEEPVAAALTYYLLFYGIVMAGPLERWGSYWIGDSEFAISLQAYLMATPTIAFFALFPNGRFVPRWTRWILILSVPWNVLLIFLLPLDFATVEQQPLAFSLLAIWFLTLVILGIYAQIVRYRRVSTPEERQQTKWVVFGFALWFGYILISSGPYFYTSSLEPGASIPWWVPVSGLGWWLSLSIVPVTLTIAITRFRLWNIDLLINRTLVYGALTASVVALYVLVIGGMGLLFQSGDSLLTPLLATGLAAVLFQPLRARLQGAVNRMMYGERDDPVAVISKLADQLEQTGTPHSALSNIVETVAQTLRLPYAAIELGEEGEAVAHYGTPVNELERIPLVYQGEAVGRLVVDQRAPGESFSPKDYQLLDNIASQAGAAAFNARLTSDLQRARTWLVTAREEERRRLRRDLHDGLGPELASLMLKLDATRNLLESDPETADRLLGELKEQVKGSVADIRRLVYNLRPPALDELGLISALRERAASFPSGAGPLVHVEGPEQMPPLPAATEVAAYRIVQEAVNNASKHGKAKECWVRLSVDDGLSLEITDDGSGLPDDMRFGVGITSMRERTSELGGTFKIESIPGGGTRVHVWMPISEEGG
jgi:signal transduction histidine kinase